MTVVLLVTSWAAGLAVYAAALAAVRREVLPLDTWTIIAWVTLVAWLVASATVILPVLRRLAVRFPGPHRAAVLSLAAVALAVVPLWLNVGFWYGWHPRALLVGETGFLSVHYATSGLVLGLALGRVVPPEGR